MVENYEMGFISPKEFLNQFSDLLAYLGSASDLNIEINNLLSPLANFVANKLKEGEHHLMNLKTLKSNGNRLL